MTTVITLVRDPGVQLRLLHSEFVNFLVCQVCSVNLMGRHVIVSGLMERRRQREINL